MVEHSSKILASEEKATVSGVMEALLTEAGNVKMQLSQGCVWLALAGFDKCCFFVRVKVLAKTVQEPVDFLFAYSSSRDRRNEVELGFQISRRFAVIVLSIFFLFLRQKAPHLT